MAIKRGVSLYCYQQEEWFGRMTWKDQLREVALNLGGATGIEIISEATIPNYPMPPESFFFEWNNEIARYGLVPVTMDTYLDTLQFRDHVMNHAEACEHIKYDLRLAKRMGFQNLRVTTGQAWDAIEAAIPLAEELNVRITSEIHAPAPIKPKFGVRYGMNVANAISIIERTGTKHYGLQPDFGIFQDRPSRVQLENFYRATKSPAEAKAIADEFYEQFELLGADAFDEYLREHHPEYVNSSMYTMVTWGRTSTDPLDLYSIAPYIFCVHGKFYNMTEIPGKPGQYEDLCINYKQPIEILKNIGYDGFINSEYEGQRSQQDQGIEGLANEIVEVRRHHEMLRRLIGE